MTLNTEDLIVISLYTGRIIVGTDIIDDWVSAHVPSALYEKYNHLPAVDAYFAAAKEYVTPMWEELPADIRASSDDEDTHILEVIQRSQA